MCHCGQQSRQRGSAAHGNFSLICVFPLPDEDRDARNQGPVHVKGHVVLMLQLSPVELDKYPYMCW